MSHVPNVEEDLTQRQGKSRDGYRWVAQACPIGPRSLRALLAKHGLAVREWRVYGGRSMVPSRGGALGLAEHLAARAVTAASNLGELGTYIETWSVKARGVDAGNS